MNEKMKYINIMGSMSDLDYVIENYISKYDIQLENALKELPHEEELTSIVTPNPYTEILREAEKLVSVIGDPVTCDSTTMTKDSAIEIINYSSNYFKSISDEITELNNLKNEYKRIIDEYEYFSNLQFNINSLSSFKFISYQFGKMPLTSYKQFEAFLYKDSEILFVEGKRDSEYQWGIYFMLDVHKDKIDSIFSSLHFHKTNFSLSLNEEIFTGTPKETYEDFLQRYNNIDEKLKSFEKSKMEEAHLSENVKIDKKDIYSAYYKIKDLHFYCETRKFAAKTKNNFFIFVGWMEKTDSADLQKLSNGDKKIIYIEEDINSSIISTPPTKLKNNFFVKPFEFFTKMYGLPSYDEIDPTPFVAITYTFLFGIMFADIGQGLVISLLGFFLSKKKKLELGSVMTVIGISSMFFGLVFGSFFGFEFHGLWISPAENENSMTFLIYAVILGIFMILVSMTLNIANAIKKKQLVSALFSPNGFSGLIFYSTIIAVAYFSFLKKIKIPIFVLIFLIILPIIFIMFKEPLTNIVTKKKIKIHGKGLFIFESIIEVFEVLLGYFTNTLSFIRVGAFVLSHASMMAVVLMLSETASKSHNIVGIILGNTLVLALEGLIVGIQVLRIEFYEMFSRFYEGAGKPFKPYNESYK